MPKPDEFEQYPAFIFFDGRINSHYTDKQLERVAFFSLPFSSYSKWKGEGVLPTAERQRIVEIIREVHNKGKKIRFWATPDNKAGWETLHSLGVDIINTDQVEKCTEYFKPEEERR